MPLLEPVRAFSGRMRNYYSGSRFAYIRLNGAEEAVYSHFSTLHAEFYELFAILAAPSWICGLLHTAIGPAVCRFSLPALQHPLLDAPRRVGKSAALLPGRLPRPCVHGLGPHGAAGQQRVHCVHQPSGPEYPVIVRFHGVYPFLVLVTNQVPRDVSFDASSTVRHRNSPDALHAYAVVGRGRAKGNSRR